MKTVYLYLNRKIVYYDNGIGGVKHSIESGIKGQNTEHFVEDGERTWICY